LKQKEQVSGVGSGIVFGLVQLAQSLKIPRIWGEATVNSAPFYERLLAVEPVQNLFIIEAREMGAVTRRREQMAHRAVATIPASKLQ